MKKYKIITSITIIIFLLFAKISTYAAIWVDGGQSSGTTSEITMTPETAQVKVGETITITLSAKCATGIEGVDSTLEYDKTKLEFTNSEQFTTTGFTTMSGVDETTGKYKLSVLYTGSGEAPTQANFATLSFKVLDGVTANQTLNIKLSEIEVGDSEDEWFTIADKQVNLTVVEAQESGDGNPDDGDPGDGNPDDGDPGDGNPDDGDPGDGNPDDGDPGDGNPEDGDPGDGNPDDGDPGDGNPDDGDPGDGNPDDGDPGDGNPDDGDQDDKDSGDKKPGDEEQDKKDPTTSDKTMNDAGLRTYSLIVLSVLAIITIMLYKKYKEAIDI